MNKVLLVEDDPLIAKVIQYYFDQEKRYLVTWAKTAGEALAFARDDFDVILLDIRLPDVNGIDLCDRLRTWHNCPIIFISALDDSDTIVKALEMGGDDYLTKPFDNKVLVARIEANIRRAHMDLHNHPSNALAFDGYIVDAHKHILTKDGHDYPLSIMEYRILRFFLQHPNRFYTANELYKLVWGNDSYGDVRTVLVHIHNLRKKIESDNTTPKYIKNVWGKGYIFNPKGN
ncbi:MAG TPA: response regulator transcription factor [Bellilinea sp.]|jgi:DNA-binding response OmpR family regulator|nr:response regulator transcription factor [Bellilinea sp.]